MPRFELVQLSGDIEAGRYPVGQKGLFIGRSDEADVVIKKDSVSRLHVKFWSQGDELVMEYLGSRDGIKVNGERMSSGALHDGDSVEVGEDLFVVSDTTIPESERTTPARGNGDSDPTLRSSKRGKRGVPKNEIVLEASHELNSLIFEFDILVLRTLEFLLEWIPVRRAFVLGPAAPGSKAPIWGRLSPAGGNDGPPVNEEVVQFVQEKRSAMIKSQQGRDAALAAPGTIAAGAICAPLMGKNGCIGTLYADSGWEPSPFDSGDLDDLKSLGRIAGLAIENAEKCRQLSQQSPQNAVQDLAAVFAESARKAVASIDAAAHKIESQLDADKLKRVQALWPLLGRTINNAELLVENMLSYARVRPLELSTVDLNEVVEKAVDAVRSRAERLGVTFELSLEEGVGASADAREVYLIILNLLSTAIDAYQRKDGVVTVRTSNETGGSAIEIAHRGQPIPPEQARELSRGTLTRETVLDIGLVATFKAVKEMGGEILLRGDAEDATAFTVILPYPRLNST